MPILVMEQRQVVEALLEARVFLETLLDHACAVTQPSLHEVGPAWVGLAFGGLPRFVTDLLPADQVRLLVLDRRLRQLPQQDPLVWWLRGYVHRRLQRGPCRTSALAA